VLAGYTQLRLARRVVGDRRLPWERPRPPGRLTPGRVRRGFRNFWRGLAPRPTRRTLRPLPRTTPRQPPRPGHPLSDRQEGRLTTTTSTNSAASKADGQPHTPGQVKSQGKVKSVPLRLTARPSADTWSTPDWPVHAFLRVAVIHLLTKSFSAALLAFTSPRSWNVTTARSLATHSRRPEPSSKENVLASSRFAAPRWKMSCTRSPGCSRKVMRSSSSMQKLGAFPLDALGDRGVRGKNDVTNRQHVLLSAALQPVQEWPHFPRGVSAAFSPACHADTSSLPRARCVLKQDRHARRHSSVPDRCYRASR
jgi:hypothetical protein